MTVLRAVVVGIAAHRLLVARPEPRRPWRPTNRHTRTERRDPAHECDEIARALRSGASLATTMHHLGISTQGDEGTLADHVARAIPDEDDADRVLMLRVVATIAVQGGSGAEALDRCASRLRARADDRRERRLAAAPARLSAAVMTVLPFGVLALLAATSTSVRSHLGRPAGAIAVGVGIALNVAGWRWMRRIIADRGDSDLAIFAEVLESVTLHVRAGLTVRSALLTTLHHVDGLMKEHLTEFGWRIEHGWLTADALAELGERIGPDARQLVDGVIRAERYGSALAPVLDRMVDDIDRVRREASLRRTRTLPVRLSAPLVVCTLPSFVLLAVLPAIGAAIAGLGTGPLSNI